MPYEPYAYRVVPEQAIDQKPDIVWKVILKSLESNRIEIPLEICGDVVLGICTPQSKTDVDLSALNAHEYGVSRHHLMLRPTKSKLFAIDLHSTNGSFVNGFSLSISQACKLRNGDILMLGRLYLGIEITSRPRSTAPLVTT